MLYEWSVEESHEIMTSRRFNLNSESIPLQLVPLLDLDETVIVSYVSILFLFLLFYFDNKMLMSIATILLFSPSFLITLKFIHLNFFKSFLLFSSSFSMKILVGESCLATQSK